MGGFTQGHNDMTEPDVILIPVLILNPVLSPPPHCNRSYFLLIEEIEANDISIDYDIKF